MSTACVPFLKLSSIPTKTYICPPCVCAFAGAGNEPASPPRSARLAGTLVFSDASRPHEHGVGVAYQVRVQHAAGRSRVDFFRRPVPQWHPNISTPGTETGVRAGGSGKSGEWGDRTIWYVAVYPYGCTHHGSTALRDRHLILQKTGSKSSGLQTQALSIIVAPNFHYGTDNDGFNIGQHSACVALVDIAGETVCRKTTTVFGFLTGYDGRGVVLD